MTTPYYTETTVIDGYTVKINCFHDSDMGPPWEEHEGHGPVSKWTQRDKRPGERVLCQERNNYRFYDFQGAIAQAKSEGWGIGPDEESALEKELGRKPSKTETIVAAVEHDFKRLKAWCNDEWFWTGYKTEITAPDGTTTEGDSCWGFDDEAYMIKDALAIAGGTIEELKAEAIKAAEAEERRKAIVAHARDAYAEEGDLEFDDDAEVSENDELWENGAYVACWKWVTFSQTPFDKEKGDEQP